MSELPDIVQQRLTRRRFLRKVARTGGSLALGGLYVREIEPFWLDLHEVELPIPNLPRAFDGFRIAHVTDLHADKHVPISYLKRMVQRVNAAAPDAVAVTGDIVNHNTHWIEPAASALSAFQAPAYVSFGNHDYKPGTARPEGYTIIADPLERALRAVGHHVLRNKSTFVERRGAKLRIVGLEDFWSTRFSPPAAFMGVSAEEPKIVLSHNPDSVLTLKPYGPSLVLSGHTHGGQVRIPFVGAPLLPVEHREYQQGLFDLNPGWMYVSRGVGFLLRARCNCRPEIPVFTLRAAAST